MSTEQSHPDQEVAASSAEPEPQPSIGRRFGIWRAVAGMAVALAIAAGIVAIDISHDLVDRVANYRSRVASLNQKVDRLKRQAVVDEKRLAAAREEIRERKLMESRDRMKAILIAPDRRTIKLTAPNQEPAVATVTISEKMGGAVLSARGLASPPDGQVYDAWWLLKNGPPAKAAEFRNGIDGSVTEFLDPPPQGSAPVSLSITMEPSEGGIAPTGPEKLLGKVAAAWAEERSGGAKKH
jgi:hypothetical protein